jgi:type II secretion system protein D
MERTTEPIRKSCFSRLHVWLILLILCIGAAASAPAQPVIRRMPGNGGGPMPMPDEMPSDSGSHSSPSGKEGGGPWVPSDTPITGTGTNATDIQLSFQGANIDMVVQWLAETTGKTVIKHPQVQCQLTITSSKKVSQREAINLVYRALALEGYTAVETSQSILIVPEGKEPRMSPEVLAPTEKIPEGRERLTKVFSLNHIQAGRIIDKIRAALTDTATVDLDERANQIVVTDYNDNIRVAGELIAALDSDRPQDVAIRVIPLRHINGQDLAKELAPLYQKMNTQDSKDAIDVAADDHSNALIVFSSQAGFNALEQVIAMLDTEGAQEKVMKTYVLTNADAQDVAKQLQDLVASQTPVSARYIFTYNESSEGQAAKPSIVPDRRRNALIIQAPPAEMESLEKMISELDQPVTDESLAPKIFHLKYVSATDVEDVLNALFLKTQQQPSYFDFFFGDQDQTPDRDVGRLYGKVRITSEPYSNTIIVTSNSKENLAVVEDVLRQLDAPSESGDSTLRIVLRFAKAEDVAKNLNILFAKNGSPPMRPENPQNQQNNSQNQDQQQEQQNTTPENNFDMTEQTKEEGYYPWIGGQPDPTRTAESRNAARPVSDLVGRVRAVPDQRINAVLLSANVHFFPQVLKLVDEMDAPSDQVVIDARIVEVSSDFLDQLGIRWAPSGTQTFTADDYDGSILASATATYMKGYGGNTAVNTYGGSQAASTTAGSGTPSVNTIAQALTSLRSGVIDNTINMDFLIQFLHRTVDATVIADTQITIKDNETGQLFVGQEVPRPANTLINNLGTQNTAVTYKEAGVTLEVAPHINSTGDIQLKIHVESSSLVANETILSAPVFNSRQFRTDLTAKEGQTLVLGGIIQRQIANTARRIPGIGRIPGLNWLTNNKNKSTQDDELMVFLRPKVIRDTQDARDALRDVNRNAPAMKRWEDETDPAMPN